MTKEIMAECLEEAGALWDSYWTPRDSQTGLNPPAIATIAAALYAERMRQEALPVHLYNEPATTDIPFATTTLWSSSGHSTPLLTYGDTQKKWDEAASSWIDYDLAPSPTDWYEGGGKRNMSNPIEEVEATCLACEGRGGFSFFDLHQVDDDSTYTVHRWAACSLCNPPTSSG